ncbi:hypothetical protein HD597_010053 [Nonomuraea thailandensis]|uniref:Uncharacterized protein n=1 Tax=Nonomuraea thailandensis TaxID=1188745 RepID=A0A9X2GY21_9ACTN|nr:hypothetical protein [Nonomuraea thailandensis]MCP2363033.1 hypothetical protein [Nonomuraea thailandensis]
MRVRRRPRTARAGRRQVPSYLGRWLRDRWRVTWAEARSLLSITSWT